MIFNFSVKHKLYPLEPHVNSKSYAAIFQLIQYLVLFSPYLVSSICLVQCLLNTFCNISQKVYQLIYAYINFACIPQHENVKEEFIQKDIFYIKTVMFQFVQKPS